MWRWTVSPEKAPNKAEYLDLEFAKGDVVAINGKKMKAHEVLGTLNEIGGKHGIGRLDLVENRYVGMKSRGCYETPGGTILLRAHRAIESVTLDREVAHLKDDLMPRYASLIYNGYWWSPERKALQVLIDHTQQTVNGTVRLKLYKGNVIVVGRDSKTDSLFDSTIATFEDDAGAYDQRDAGGFIKLNALRMRIAANLAARKAAQPAAASKAAVKKGCKAGRQAGRPSLQPRRPLLPRLLPRRRAKRWKAPYSGSTKSRSRISSRPGVSVPSSSSCCSSSARSPGSPRPARRAPSCCSSCWRLAWSVLSPRQSFRKSGVFKCRNTTMFPWSRRPMFILTASASATPWCWPMAPRRPSA
jgi:argininosuccinate synthase